MRSVADRPASQGAEFAEERTGEYSLLAAFPNMTLARDAIEALSRAGIEGQQITLRGPAADEAAEEGEFRHPADNAAADAGLISRWASRVAQGAAMGAVLGVILGVPVGIIGIELLTDNDVTFGTVAASAFLGALFLSTIFALVSHVYQLPAQTQAWELTFHDTWDSRNVVGVHVRTQEELETARNVLESMNAREIEVVEPGASAYRATERLAHR